jgi:hypothetical protein
MHTQLRLNFHKISKSLIDILNFKFFCMTSKSTHYSWPMFFMFNIDHQLFPQHNPWICKIGESIEMPPLGLIIMIGQWVAGILFCSRPYEGHSTVYSCTCVKMLSVQSPNLLWYAIPWKVYFMESTVYRPFYWCPWAYSFIIRFGYLLKLLSKYDLLDRKACWNSGTITLKKLCWTKTNITRWAKSNSTFSRSKACWNSWGKLN